MNGDGNFKMKCINIYNDNYTNDKVYEVKNGRWVNDVDILMGDNRIKTIEDVNTWSNAAWELVEEETSEPIKNELSVSERMKKVASMLGLELNEEFNVICTSGMQVTNNPFKFTKEGLVDKDLILSNVILSMLLINKYKIQKLPWKPKNGHIVWYILTNQRTDDGKFENLPHSFTFKSNNLTHLALYKSDWMFRTKKEAEANMERVLKEMKEVTGDE